MTVDGQEGLAGAVRRWGLVVQGEVIQTNSSDVWPVQYQGQSAMLKVARTEEERRGQRLMVWWGGLGAARVYAHEGAALLMERVDDDLSLAALALSGHDDEATQTLCRAVKVLHAVCPQPWPELLPLAEWFRALEAAAPQGGTLGDCWALAQRLLREQRDLRPLHGDIHHGNVLHSRERGWLVIDPKGLIGERTFDYANIFCNPDLEFAAQPRRLARQAQLVAQAARVDRSRLLGWMAAYAGLSAAWHLEDDDAPQAELTLDIARLALAELGA